MVEGNLERQDVRDGAGRFDLWEEYSIQVPKGAEEVAESHIRTLRPNVVILFMTN